MKRQEKRQEKLARRSQRKEEKGSGGPQQEDELQPLDGPVSNFDDFDIPARS